MSDEIREAIEIVKSNWPDEKYTMLRGALEILIFNATSKDAVQEDVERQCRNAAASQREAQELLDQKEKLVEALKEILFDCEVYYHLLPNSHRMTWKKYYKEQIDALTAAGAMEGE